MNTTEIMQRIRDLQDIQKANSPGSPLWEAASKELAPLFAEMARRQESAEGKE